MRARLLWLSLCVSAGCSHDLSSMFGPEAKTREADALLAAGDIEAARAAYRKVLVDFPAAPNALFGAAFTDLILIGGSAPARALTDVCHQVPLDLAGMAFGPGGFIAQSVEAREGQATVDVHYFSAPGEAASDLVFRPVDVRARLEPPTRADPRRVLYMTLSERDVANARVLVLEVNADDIARGDDEVTPLADGAEVDVDRLAGYLDFYDFSFGGSRSEVPLAGKLRFVKAGREVGEELVLDLSGVRLPAYVPDSCGGSCGPAWYAIAGHVSDRLSSVVDVDPSQVPFSGLMADGGMPRRAEEIVAIDGCSPVDDRFVAQHVRGVGDVLEADAAQLAAILESPARATFSFEIPRELFRSQSNLPVNSADVRALRGWLLTWAGALELVGQYRWLSGELQAQVEEHDWAYEGETAPARARVLWPVTLAMNLETGFFTQPAGFDLSRARDRLQLGLGELGAAMLEKPATPGLFEFDARRSARLVSELAGVFTAMSQSVVSERPVPIPSAPLYTTHLRAFFDSPLDAARLRQLMSLLRLWEVREGDLGAPNADERNPALRFELDLLNVRGWSGGIFDYPAPASAPSCSQTMACPSGYTCQDTTCELVPPWYATEEAWSGSTTQLGWPAFISAAVRDALAVDL